MGIANTISDCHPSRYQYNRICLSLDQKLLSQIRNWMVFRFAGIGNEMAKAIYGNSGHLLGGSKLLYFIRQSGLLVESDKNHEQRSILLQLLSLLCGSDMLPTLHNGLFPHGILVDFSSSPSILSSSISSFPSPISLFLPFSMKICPPPSLFIAVGV